VGTERLGGEGIRLGPRLGGLRWDRGRLGPLLGLLFLPIL
jgi:hypothetical protein